MNSSDIPIGVVPPPPGVTADFGHHAETNTTNLLCAAIIWPVLAIAIVCIRMFTASRITRRWHADDFLIIGALVFAVANSIISGIQIRNGAGLHMWEVTLVEFKRFMMLGSIGGNASYNFATLFVKTSILTFYLRFSVERLFRITCYAVMVVAAGYSFVSALFFAFMCKPVAAFWDPTIVGGKCSDVTAGFLACAALNVVTDVIILLLPIWLLWPLRVGPLQKLAVAVILMTGGLVTGISIVRMQTLIDPGSVDDITWTYATNLAWCLHEMFTGVLCACLPCLRPFTKHFWPDCFLFRGKLEARKSIRLYADLHNSSEQPIKKPSSVHVNMLKHGEGSDGNGTGSTPSSSHNCGETGSGTLGSTLATPKSAYWAGRL